MEPPTVCAACRAGFHELCTGYWEWCTCTTGTCLTELLEPEGEP